MSSTTQGSQELKRVLGRMDLMSAAVGQIVGAGVMVMSISALGMTGRSVNIAFVVASIFTIIAAIPSIFYGSVLRVKGGTYTQAALFVGEKFAGFYMVTYIFSNMSIAMYAVGFTSYLTSLVPSLAGMDTLISIAVMTLFFVLNFFGVEWMAKIQNVMFYLLVVALIIFTAFGVPQVEWGGYFGNELFGTPLFENGLNGFMTAATYLTFATGGATVIMQFSGEAINPQKDIPFVIIVSTLCVSVLYAFMASCIGGILPPDVVIEAGNLSVIAFEILPTPLYYFFMICGAMFALGTTLNATIGWVTKPLLQACKDGWFPKVLGTLHPKFATPYYLQLMFYVVNLGALIMGWNVSQLGQLSLIISNVIAVMLAAGVMRLPKLFPEAWAKSPFHVPDAVFKALLILASCTAAYQAWMQINGTTGDIVIFNAITFVVAFLYSNLRHKSGQVNVTVSYELG